jgi:hypothetical protein
VTAPFDRSALALNVGEATGAYGQVLALMRKIGAYTSALDSLNLDPVAVHGGRLDAFQNLPGLRQALLTARGHTPPWVLISQQLFGQLLESGVYFKPLLKAASAEIERIVNTALEGGRALTKSEMTSIITKVQGLETVLQRHRDNIAMLRTSTVDFARVVAGDYAALSTGAQRIDEAIPAIEKATMDAALKYLDPLSQGIYKMVVEQGAKIRAKLVETANGVHGLVDANDASQRALQSVGTAWATVDGKFKSVITALSEGEQATDAFVELPIALEVAAASWEQLEKYLMGQPSASFLGSPGTSSVAESAVSGERSTST